MRQVAVIDGRILLVGIVAIGSRPMVGGSILSIGSQMNGIANAEWTVVAHQWRHNATVGLTIACVFLESDVTATSSIVRDKQDVILSYLSVHDVGILV